MHCCLAIGSHFGNVVAVLVNATSILLNALRLIGSFGLVVLRQEQNLFASVHRHDGPAVAYIR